MALISWSVEKGSNHLPGDLGSDDGGDASRRRGDGAGFAAVHAKRRGQPIFVPTWIFVAGYLLVWTAVGLAVYVLVQIGRDFTASLTSASPSTGAPIAEATLALAGLYQLTPLKRVCLTHCRSPLGFVLGHWREDAWERCRWGSAGGYCLGCCWALFAVLVVAGIMKLGLDAPADTRHLR